MHWNVLTDRTATVGCWHDTVVCPSVRLHSVRLSVSDAVHCGAQGRCTGVGGCTSVFLWQGASYSLLQALLLYRLATEHQKADRKQRQTY